MEGDDDDDGLQFPYKMIADPSRQLATSLGIVDHTSSDETGLYNVCNAVLVVGPHKVLKLAALYPAYTERNLEEILRVVDSLQLMSSQSLGVMENWMLRNSSVSPSNVTTMKGLTEYGTTIDLPSKKY